MTSTSYEVRHQSDTFTLKEPVQTNKEPNTESPKIKEQKENTVIYTEFFSWGSDQFGQLGLAEAESDTTSNATRQQFHCQPKSLSFDIRISQIACGDFHAAFISDDSQVFCMGKNSEGQLGVGDTTLQMSSAPLLIEGLPPNAKPKQIACGGSHSALVTRNGQLYTWGSGKYGATGSGSSSSIFTPALPRFSDKDFRPEFQFVDCGKYTTVAVTAQAQVVGCGDNRTRQLGMQDKDEFYEFATMQNFYEEAQKVACGNTFTLIQTDTDLYAVGDNSKGCLGQGHTYSSDVPLKVHGLQDQKIADVKAGRHAAILTEAGALYVWGPALDPKKPILQPQELRSDKAVLYISISQHSSAIINEIGQLYTWGVSNSQGQLGNTSDRHQNAPILVASLADRVATKVAAGLDFCIALGQDCELCQNTMALGTVVAQESTKTEPTRPSKRQNSQQIISQPVQMPGSSTIQPQSTVPRCSTSINQSESKQQIQFDLKIANFDNSENQKDVAKLPKPQTSNISQRESAQRAETVQQSHQDLTGRSHNSTAHLAGQIAELTKSNRKLLAQNKALTQKLKETQQSNDFLMKNAEQEIAKMSNYIDDFIAKEQLKKCEVKREYEARLQKERQLSRQMQQQIADLQIQVKALKGEYHRTGMQDPVSVSKQRRSSRENHRYKRTQESACSQFELISPSRKLQAVESVQSADFGGNKEDTKKAWPTDLYFEREEVEPLPQQLRAKQSSPERLANLLGLENSPIRSSVGRQALYVGSRVKELAQTPPRQETPHEKFTRALANEDFTQYGPVSRLVFADQTNTLPDKIHKRSGSKSKYLSGNTSMNRRTPNRGNHEQKKYVEDAQSIHNDSVYKRSDRALSAVKNRLQEMQKSKEKLERKLHQYEAKLHKSFTGECD